MDCFYMVHAPFVRSPLTRAFLKKIYIYIFCPLAYIQGSWAEVNIAEAVKICRVINTDNPG